MQWYKDNAPRLSYVAWLLCNTKRGGVQGKEGQEGEGRMSLKKGKRRETKDRDMDDPSGARPTKTTMGRRTFLRRARDWGIRAAIAAPFIYGLEESQRIVVSRPRVKLNSLPPGLTGLRIAVIADVHHSAILPLPCVRRMVDLANAQAPDVIALVGDYVSDGAKYIVPVFGELARLRARYGVYGVLGNWDCFSGAAETRAAMRSAGIVDLTNAHAEVRTPGGSLWLAGVDDPSFGLPDLDAALSGVPLGAATVLLVHEPPFVERLGSAKVGLMLAGHTHGGQIVLPFYGPPILPSKECRPYLSGLFQRPNCQLYVSRGVGYYLIPFRFDCPAELPVITLEAG